MSLLTALAGNRVAKGVAGFGLNVLPGYSTLGSQISDPTVNYQGQANPGYIASPTQQTQGHVLGAETSNAPAQSGAYGAAGSGSGGNAVDLSSYDQSIDATNANINTLTPQLNAAIQGALNQYQTTVNGLNQQKAQTDQVYGQNVDANKQDFVTNKNTINTNTGNTIGSINRVGGTRGASGQSALAYAAQLAAGQGTQQRTGAANTFAKNAQGLDQNYGNFVNTFNQNLTSASQQRDADQTNARVNYDTNRANLLQSLARTINQRTSAAGGTGTGASQGYVNEAKGLLAEASGLGAPRAVAAQQPLVYNAPTLDSYTAAPTAIQASGGNAATQSATPFLTALLNRDKQLQAA